MLWRVSSAGLLEDSPFPSQTWPWKSQHNVLHLHTAPPLCCSSWTLTCPGASSLSSDETSDTTAARAKKNNVDKVSSYILYVWVRQLDFLRWMSHTWRIVSTGLGDIGRYPICPPWEAALWKVGKKNLPPCLWLCVDDYKSYLSRVLTM